MAQKLKLVLCWHFHQPDYRHPETGWYRLPWTYLHATKDYADMAAHLEDNPDMKAVVNFVPILVEQLDDYARQLTSGELRDPLLALLAREDLSSLSREERHLILDACFRCNEEKLIDPFPAYRRLHDLYLHLIDSGEAALAYLSGQYFADLLTWYHIAWTGETVRRQNSTLASLLAKAEGFDLTDRLALLGIYRDIIGELMPRYRKLAERGQIELSATPYNHPLAPLMVNFNAAHEAQPGTPLPHAPVYPGGRGRVTDHIKRAQNAHQEHFGTPPAGMWPAEGSVSDDVVRIFASQGVRWLASGQKVLENSLGIHGGRDRTEFLYRPYRPGHSPQMRMFFRDDILSDLIGFEYARWFGADAIHHFMAQLEDIRRRAPEHETPTVSIILDGENAWEYYPYNGYYFLSGLYQALATHPDIEVATFSECLEDQPAPLERLVAGSWVYGTFSTWIGDAAKNRAWELLTVAKANLDLRLPGLSPQAQEEALAHLANCEASDWFWWMGDYNPSKSVAQFDTLFRHNLRLLYGKMGLAAPANLDEPISHGSDGPGGHSGSMRRSS